MKKVRIFLILSNLFLFLNFTKICIGQDLRDVKSPVGYPANLFIPVALASILLISSIVLTVVYFNKNKRKLKKFEKMLSPWETAAQRLQSLINEDLLSKGLFKEFYLNISDIIRKYFEEQFCIKAPEMTTEEFLSNLQKSDLLNLNQKDSMRQFLTACDMVKFAKYCPDIEEGKKTLDLAVKLVEHTKIESETNESKL